MTRLRLTVFRSGRHIYGQIIDTNGKTLLTVGDLSDPSTSLWASLGDLTKTEKARRVGKLLAQKALERNIKEVFFDRGKFKYHGRVKAFAEGAREGGLKF